MIKCTFNICFFWLFMSIGITCSAQISGIPKNGLTLDSGAKYAPFDVPFDAVKTISGSVEITGAYLFETNPAGCPLHKMRTMSELTSKEKADLTTFLNAYKDSSQRIKKSARDWFLSRQPGQPLQIGHITTKNKDQTQIKISIPPLKPAQNYKLLVTTSVQLDTSLFIAIDSAKKLMSFKSSIIYDIIKRNQRGNPGSELGCFNFGNSDPDFNKICDTVNQKLDTIFKLKKLLKTCNLAIPCANLKQMFGDFLSCNQCKGNLKFIVTNMFSIMNYIVEISDCKKDVNDIDKINAFDFKSQLSHCDTALKYTSEIMKLACINNQDTYNHFSDLFKDYCKCLESNRSNLKQILSKIDNLKSYINNKDKYLLGTSTISLNTYVSGLTTRSAYVIIPDFGAMEYFCNPNPKDWGVMPYLGFEINFRPMDKNIPFRIYPHVKPFSIHHWSFNAGILAQSIAISNQRADFFTKNSIFLGFGYRLGSGVRLTAGTMLFRKYDTNPFTTTPPTIAIAPYFGVSLDLDLKALFNGFSNLLN